MSNKILENVNVGDHVELYTIKGDVKQGIVTTKHDGDEVLGICIDGGNVESRYNYALIAGCEIKATGKPSPKPMPKQAETEPAAEAQQSKDTVPGETNKEPLKSEHAKDMPIAQRALGEPNPIASTFKKKAAMEMFGVVSDAVPDFHDRTRCYQWIIVTDNKEKYRFNERNITDMALLKVLQEKFSKNQQFNEEVKFEPKLVLDKWGKELCFANKVRRREKIVKIDPSMNTRYKKAIEKFLRGKDHDREILPIFLEYFKVNPSKELVNNICTLFIRLDEPLKAVEFVEEEKAKTYLTEVERLNIKYQSYRKADEPEKAFEVESIIITSTSNPAQKRHHIELVVKYLLLCQRYDETLHYCEMWLALGIGKGNDENVSNVYRRRQICLTAAECIVKLRSYGDYEPNEQLLKEINADEQAAAILTSEAGGQTYDYAFEDLGYMGVIAKDRIEELNLLEAPDRLNLLRQIIDPETGHFRGEPDKSISVSAREIAGRFTRNIVTEKPLDRYESCIYAARVLYDALKVIRDRNEADNNLEVLMCKYLSQAMASHGDYAISVSRTAIREEARLYYIESIKYANVEKADRKYAVTRCILSVFLDRELVTMHSNNVGTITKHLNNLAHSAKLNVNLLLGVIARIIANVPPNQTDSIQNDLIDAIYPSGYCREIAHELFISENKDPQDQVSKEELKLSLDSFRKKYRELENTFVRCMERISEQACFKREWIEDTQQNMDAMRIFFKYMDDFDRENCHNFMRELLDIANKFYNAEHYEEREDCLKNMIVRIDERDRSIRETPAQYSYERLRKALKAWREVSIRELHGLYAQNQPELNCELISGLSAGEDGIVNLPINISNQKDRQKADDIEISIEPKDDVYEFKSLDSGSSRMIKGGGQKDCVLRILLKDMEPKAVTVYVNISYTYKDENGDEKKDQRQYPLNAFFFENRKVNFVNPYAIYTESGAVSDRSMTFGRDELINEVIAMLKGNDATPLRSKMLLLYGQKRAGKSTVLLHLTNEIREKVPDAIVVDFGDIGGLTPDRTRFEEFFYKRFFEKFAAELQGHHTQLADALLENGISIPGEDRMKNAADARYEMGSFFDRLNRYIASSGIFTHKTVVILLDEFTYLYGWIKKGEVDKEFMKYWKAMISEYKLVAIAAAQDYIGDFIAAFPNQFGTTEMKPVDYLEKDDVWDMINKPFPVPHNSLMAAFDHMMGDEAFNRIMKLTAGNAYLTMIFLDRLVDYLNETNQPIVMPVTVENVLRKKILNGNNPLRLENFESLYIDDGDISDPSRPMHNLALLWVVALQCERGEMCAKEDIIIPEKVKDASSITQDRISFLIDKMITRGVLTRKEGRDAYRIRVDMFREWLLTNCGIDLINSRQ